MEIVPVDYDAKLREGMQRLIHIEQKINYLLGISKKLDVNTTITHPDQRWGSTTYAQHGDDIIILAIFDRLGIAKPSYMDIGAHHPFNISNTALLYQRGSRGVNIEANPALFKAFEAQRPEDVNLNIGVTDEAGELDFYMFGPLSGLNTFDKTRAAHLEETTRFKVVETIKVKTATVNSVVETYCNGRFPDLLSLDVEGLDDKILKSIDYSRWKPAVVCVEGNTPEERRRIDAVLSANGYRLIFRSIVNLFYVDDSRFPSLLD